MDGDLIIRLFLSHCKWFINDVRLNLKNRENLTIPSEYDQIAASALCNYHTRGKEYLNNGLILKGLDCYTEAICCGSHQAHTHYGLIWYGGKHRLKDIDHGMFHILTGVSKLDPYAIRTLQKMVEQGITLGNYHDTALTMLDDIDKSSKV